MNHSDAAFIEAEASPIVKSELKKEIGLWGLTANIINIIIGAGIFVMPAVVAQYMGAESILAYLFCGLLVFLTMLCFAEIGSKITAAGGPYAYIHTVFGNLAGFITLIIFIASMVTADAAVANALFLIIGSLVPALQTTFFKITFFVVFFYGLAFINIRGIKEGIGLIKIITLLKLIPLLILLAYGWTSVTWENLIWNEIPEIPEVASLSMILFFAFQGGESALPISEEVKNPQKTVPQAIFISLSVILILYIFIQLTAQGVLGNNLAQYTESPLAEVALRSIGPIGFTLLIIGAAVSMFGNVSGEILNGPRVLFGAARDLTLPIQALSKIHPKFKTPYIAILVYTSISFILAVSGGFVTLAIASSFFVLLIYMGIALSVIRYRKIHPESPGFRIWGGILVPVLVIMITFWFISSLSRDELLAGAGFILLMVIIYFIINAVRKTW